MNAVISRLVAEKELQRAVLDAARVFGWRWYHTHDSRRSPEGFPDLVLVKPPQLIFAELKSEKGRVTPQQAEWLRLLEACGQEAVVWRPSDFDDVVARLKKLP